MAYQPRVKSPRAARYRGKKPLHEKGKRSERRNKHVGDSAGEEKHVANAEEVTEGTLRRLHTLGNQRFGTFPFSEHFDRWLLNLTDVLDEFESSPNINPDDQFLSERAQLIATIERQLREKRRKEATVEADVKIHMDSKNLLEQIKKEYVASAGTLRALKKGEIRRLYGEIDRLRRAQDEVVRMKTGFFRGVSKRVRERKEAEVVLELNDRQKELELAVLDFTVAKEKLRDEYDEKRAPIIHQMRGARKRIDEMDTDGSLEERWFACEALADAVNAFLQRKTLQPN